MDVGWVIFCLWATPILLFVVLPIIVGAWLVWEKWLTPQESKIIRKASRQKKAIDFLASDDGYGDFTINEVVGKGGYAETSKEEKKKWTGFFARSISETEMQTDKKEDAIANLMNKLASRKLYLRSAKIPIWFGYSGKAILTSIYSLVALDAVEQTAMNGGKPQANPIDMSHIKSLFDKPWDQTQIRAQRQDARTEGALEQKKFSGLESWKGAVVPVSIILALVMGVIVLSVIFLR